MQQRQTSFPRQHTIRKTNRDIPEHYRQCHYHPSGNGLAPGSICVQFSILLCWHGMKSLHDAGAIKCQIISD
jgi:hypothetical protein